MITLHIPLLARFVALAALVGTAPGPRLAAAEPEPFDPGRLEREVLVTGLRDCVQFQFLPDGGILLIERAGAVKLFTPATKTVLTIGEIPVALIAESHLTGILPDPAFAANGWVYLYFSPKVPGNVMHLSRFTIRDGALDLGSEKILLTIPFMPLGHTGGGMQFDAAGNLWLSIGDNAAANVTPETDERPGRENYNALGTAANTQDLRGKIIRITPRPDGTYTVPPGNLFADPAQGRPEIYIMGCRNPYRFHFDSPGGTLYWGEVGSNTEERFGTGGYDEISRSRGPANSGWPLFIGPDTPYRRYDHATNTLGDLYSAERPVNESRLNTGLRELPKPLPALIWYGSEDSKEFPELGNGGRSAMVGFLYRHDSALDSPVKLPAHFDGRLFIYDWCRNWIKAVTLDAQGGVAGIAPFAGDMILRRPIDIKAGPDGAAYLLEFGDKWAGNTDGVLSRIVYRRGNRPPVAVATAEATAGRAPLTVRFSAARSSDPDGDALAYHWSFGDGAATATGREASWTYREKGLRQATLLVTDAAGLSHTATVAVAVGNAPPAVRITAPAHGSFFDWGQTVPFALEVEDAEDGATAAGTIPAADVRVRWTYRDQPAASLGAVPQIGFEGGAGLMRKSDCLSCHQLATPSVGPSFLAVADRYRGDATAAARIADKILKGGAGAWGEIPMPPHPQHSAADVAAMAEYILTRRPPDTGEPVAGLRGELAAKDSLSSRSRKGAGGRHVLTASYRDRGAAGVPPLTTEARAVLHARRTRAALFDAGVGVTTMEVATLRRDRRICTQLGAGSHLVFREVNLASIARIACEVSAGAGHGGALEFRADSPTGKLVGRVAVPETGQWDVWKTVSAPVADPGGVRDLYVVVASDPGGKGKKINLDVIEFVAAARRP